MHMRHADIYVRLRIFVILCAKLPDLPCLILLRSNTGYLKGAPQKYRQPYAYELPSRSSCCPRVPRQQIFVGAYPCLVHTCFLCDMQRKHHGRAFGAPHRGASRPVVAVCFEYRTWKGLCTTLKVIY
jgi:hypothetical protein